MNAVLKKAVRRLRDTEGALDVEKGLPPKSTSRFYLEGYSKAYAEQQYMTQQKEYRNEHQPF